MVMTVQFKSNIQIDIQRNFYAKLDSAKFASATGKFYVNSLFCASNKN